MILLLDFFWSSFRLTLFLTLFNTLLFPWVVLLSWGLQSGHLSKYEVSEVESLKEFYFCMSLCLCLGDESGSSLMSSVSKAGLILLLYFMCVMCVLSVSTCADRAGIKDGWVDICQQLMFSSRYFWYVWHPEPFSPVVVADHPTRLNESPWGSYRSYIAKAMRKWGLELRDVVSSRLDVTCIWSRQRGRACACIFLCVHETLEDGGQRWRLVACCCICCMR